MKPNREIGISHPSNYPPEYKPLSYISTFDLIKTVYNIFKYDVYTRIAVLKCLVMSICVSIASTFIAMLHKYENGRMEVCDGEINVSEDTALMFKEWIISMTGGLQAVIDSYKFLPLFLLLAYVGFLLDRWRQFMVTCHIIQGRLHDIAMLVGSIPDSKNITKEEKKQLYKIYRTMNVLYILVYKPVLREEFSNDTDFSYFVELGLLTKDEASAYVSRGRRARDGLFSTLVAEIDMLLSMSTTKKYLESTGIVIKEKVVCYMQCFIFKLFSVVWFISICNFEYLCSVAREDTWQNGKIFLQGMFVDIR